MAKDDTKGVPPPTPKSTAIYKKGDGDFVDTGGDMFDRARGRYAKNQPVREEDPFDIFDKY